MDKDEIVNLYITRDEKLNINNNSSIIFNLNKLGYHNFDFQKLQNNFIRSVYINEIKNNKDIFKELLKESLKESFNEAINKNIKEIFLSYRKN
jgi:hypothetical protein